MMDHFTHFLLRLGDDIAALVTTLLDILVEWFKEMYHLALAVLFGIVYLLIALKLAELN